MSPTTNNWRFRRIEHCINAEIVTDIATQNSERKDTKLSYYWYIVQDILIFTSLHISSLNMNIFRLSEVM